MMMMMMTPTLMAIIICVMKTMMSCLIMSVHSVMMVVTYWGKQVFSPIKMFVGLLVLYLY